MIPYSFFLAYCIILLLILIFFIIGAYYQRNYQACSTTQSPFCHTDWLCKVPNVSQAQLNQLVEAGIIPEGTQVGDEYNVKEGIFDKLLNRCKTSADGENVYVNSITGIPCNPEEGDPSCKTVPALCTKTLVGNDPLTSSNVWGISI